LANISQEVKVVAELTVDLSVVPMDEFAVHRNPEGKLYHRIDFEVAISV
jgi:hypothetical protein